MKKWIAIVLTAVMVLTLCACGSKPATTEEPVIDEPMVGVPNPMREVASLEELNALSLGGRLAHPPVMGVTDEAFFLIDCTDFTIAQYNFSINGQDYCYRFSSDFTEDISGIYVEDGTLFENALTETPVVREYEGGIAARTVTVDGQYVLSTDTMDADIFEGIARELFSLAVGEDAVGDILPGEEFIGDWHEVIAGRGSMTVTMDNGELFFEVRWPNSAAEVYTWTFSAPLGEDGTVSYSNALKISALYSTDGSCTETVLEENGCGTISISDEGNIVWYEDGGYEDGNVFARNE